MSLRNVLQQQPIVAVVLAVAIVIFAWSMIYRQTAGSRAADEPATYTYYDVTNGKLFTSDYRDPPADGPSGPATGVLAHVFTCGSCANEADRFVGYVTSFAGMPQPSSPGGDHIARAERPLKWHPRDSAEGKAIAQSISKKCDAPKACD